MPRTHRTHKGRPINPCLIAKRITARARLHTLFAKLGLAQARYGSGAA
ncbi:MAG: hypothetical protein V2I27_11450 [Erythrobacter sp.]|nr:hypothetical protein [Erythrobacter sp.]